MDACCWGNAFDGGGASVQFVLKIQACKWASPKQLLIPRRFCRYLSFTTPWPGLLNELSGRDGQEPNQPELRQQQEECDHIQNLWESQHTPQNTSVIPLPNLNAEKWGEKKRENTPKWVISLVDILAPKKIFSPPPQIPPFAADTLPAPRPHLPPGDPPSWDFQKKNRTPPRPRASDSPFPSPKQKKNKKYPKRPPSFKYFSELFCTWVLEGDLSFGGLFCAVACMIATIAKTLLNKHDPIYSKTAWED